MYIPLQVPPAATNGQLDGYMEYMAHGEPVGGVAGPGRPHDRDPADIAYHGMIDYCPLPLRVSDVHISSIDHLLADEL